MAPCWTPEIPVEFRSRGMQKLPSPEPWANCRTSCSWPLSVLFAVKFAKDVGFCFVLISTPTGRFNGQPLGIMKNMFARLTRPRRMLAVKNDVPAGKGESRAVANGIHVVIYKPEAISPALLMRSQV